MELIKEYFGDTVVAKVSGTIDIETADVLENELFDEIKPYLKYLVIDILNVDNIFSCGLKTLLKLQSAMQENDGELKVYNPSNQVSKIFEITGFSEILEIKRNV